NRAVAVGPAAGVEPMAHLAAVTAEARRRAADSAPRRAAVADVVFLIGWNAWIDFRVIRHAVVQVPACRLTGRMTIPCTAARRAAAGILGTIKSHAARSWRDLLGPGQWRRQNLALLFPHEMFLPLHSAR